MSYSENVDRFSAAEFKQVVGVKRETFSSYA